MGWGSIPLIFFLVLLTGCLREKPPRPAADVAREAALETKVRALIEADPILSDQPIEVEVNNGTVVLKGKVDREDQKEKAAEVAFRAAGDVPIQNKITVQGKKESADLGRPLLAVACFCPLCPSGVGDPQSAHSFCLGSIPNGYRPSSFDR
ncbi:MAG: BON domain-containing protein [Candidatus Manganitrophaceae bacterium]|nr:MAG: BON domain-containing protein [Candidatus Manganitrophaceae bacterium]